MPCASCTYSGTERRRWSKLTPTLTLAQTQTQTLNLALALNPNTWP